MKNILIIITSLVFLTGCGTSSYNTGNIANGGSVESVQESKTTDKHPKGTQKATVNEALASATVTVALVAVMIMIVALFYEYSKL